MITFRPRTATAFAIAVMATALALAPSWSEAAETASAALSVSITVRPAATVSLSTSRLVWSSVTSGSDAVGPDDGQLQVSGFLRTSAAGGAGSLMLVAPSDLIGQQSANDVLPISHLSMTCSGNGNSGTNAQPLYNSAYTPLHANGSTTCASWGSDSMVQMRVNLGVFFDPHSVPADTYSSGGFAIVATAT